jgi:hypothetical protein
MDDSSFGEKITRFINDCTALRREYREMSGAEKAAFNPCVEGPVKDWEDIALAQSKDIAKLNAVIFKLAHDHETQSGELVREVAFLKRLICRMDIKCPVCGSTSTEPFVGGIKMFSECRDCGAICERKAP